MARIEPYRTYAPISAFGDGVGMSVDEIDKSRLTGRRVQR
jgi:hypothetical protein